MFRLRTILLILAAAVMLGACATTQPKSSEKQQKLASIHYQIGIDALGKPGMLPKAFDELMESDAILPNQPHVLDALAYAWLLRGDMGKSEAYYKRAINAGGGAATHNNYANLLNRQNRHPEAEQEARRALDDPRYPNQDLAFINLGDALLGQNRYDDAIAAYQQAELFNRNGTLPRLRIAQASSKAGRLREAAALYQVLYKSEGDSRQVVEGYIDILIQLRQRDRALQVLNEYANRNISLMNRAWAQQKMEQVRNP